jgi:glycosyltransferase involved in cell wall biosynthesis
MVKPQKTSDPLRLPQEDMTATVIIAVYNAENYLAQTLDSAASQTGFGPEKKNNGIEVILIDDFSKDNSRKIIEQYTGILERKGFSVRSIAHPENRGTTKSYTEGALMARGKYFKILDHDDLLASERALVGPVEYMESMEARGCRIGAVFSKSLYIDGQNGVFGEKRFPFPFLPYEAKDGVIAKKWGRFVLTFSPIYPFAHGSSVVRTKCWQELSAGLLSRENIGLFDVALPFI